MSAFDDEAFDCSAFWTDFVERCCNGIKRITVYVIEFCGCK